MKYWRAERKLRESQSNYILLPAGICPLPVWPAPLVCFLQAGVTSMARYTSTESQSEVSIIIVSQSDAWITWEPRGHSLQDHGGPRLGERYDGALLQSGVNMSYINN